MKKYISVLLAILFCISLSVTALCETVTISPEDTSIPNSQSSLVTYGDSWINWAWIIGIALVVILVVIIIIKNKNKK